MDPGTVGGEAQNFYFENNPAAIVDLLWSDNKTLEWEAGTHLFFLAGAPCANYAGILLDEAGSEIPETELIGKTQCAAGSELSSGLIELSETTVFSGIRLSGPFNTDAGWQWNWNPDDRPAVGETQASGNTPPTANAGADVNGQVGVPVAFDGRNSFDDGTIVQYDWDFGDNSPKAIDAGPTPSHPYTAPGSYNVALTVTDDGGLSDSDDVIANIAAGTNPPTANAGGPTYTGTENVPVGFDGSLSSDPDGEIVQYDWNFGDGNSLFDGGSTPSHVYTAPGDYTVYLAVTDNLNAITSALTSASIIAGGPILPPAADAVGPYAGDTDTKTTMAAIVLENQLPTADASGPYAGVVNQPVILDGSASDDPDGTIVSYDWDFDDGNTGSGLFSTHTYTAPGAYTARLTVTDNDGDTAESTASVIVGDAAKLLPRPVANGPYNGVAGVPVTFDGSNSTDPDGTINWYDWEFGDGNSVTGSTPDNTYTGGGLYSVLLHVTDDHDLTASDASIARIGNLSLPPNARLNTAPFKGRVGVALAFDASESSDPDGTINRYDWEFGDGNIASNAGATPTHVYATDSSYIARLTVTDDSGETDTNITVVHIGIGNLPPLAQAGDVVSGKVRRDITFNGTGSSDPDGDIVSYAWEFGDGNTGTGPNPTHSYADAGKYFVTLTVTDSDGAISSDATLVDAEKKSGGSGGSSGSCFINTIMGQ